MQMDILHGNTEFGQGNKQNVRIQQKTRCSFSMLSIQLHSREVTGAGTAEPWWTDGQLGGWADRWMHAQIISCHFALGN